jgi:tetratricopeptide (TPR) repeat protein
VVTDRYVLPVDVDLLAIQPHAHNLARRMEAVATLPDGVPLPLITIADWDFRWQEIYRYAQPIPLPAGTAVSMRYVYDNSSSNPRNPNTPPRRVVWGQNTANEMGDLWLQVVTRGDENLRTLSADVSRRMRKEDLAANLVLLKANPNDPMHHDTVGILYLDSGRAVEAAEHFRESLRRRPDFAPTRYNLGLALITQRRYDAAIVELELAVSTDPSHADAHNTLGAMYHTRGRIREAAEQYRLAVTLRPDNIGARTNLTWILAASADDTLRNPQEAIRVAETTVELTQNAEPTALDTLAAAWAAAGDFDKAQALARAALTLARNAGNTAIASQIEQRLLMYTQGRAFRLPQ